MVKLVSEVRSEMNLEVFKKSIVGIDAMKTNVQVLMYYNAILESLGIVRDEKKVLVEKSVSNLANATRILYLFPKAKFIHIIRNPYANLVSFRNFLVINSNGKRYPSIRETFKSLYQSYYYLSLNKDSIPSNQYLILRYEDLIESPRLKMTQVCDFLNIPFSESILTPTVMGKFWEGNSTRGVTFQTVSNNDLSKPEKNILPFELELVNRTLLLCLEEFDYPTMTLSKNRWLAKHPAEDIRGYFYNRLYKYFSP